MLQEYIEVTGGTIYIKAKYIVTFTSYKMFLRFEVKGKAYHDSYTAA